MKFYDRANYDFAESVNIAGSILQSCYNHNYYVNNVTGDVVLEDCNDDSLFDYYHIEQDGRKIYLGCIRCVSGIFPYSDGSFPSDVPLTSDGAVQLWDE